MKFSAANNGKTMMETLIALTNNIPILSALTSPITEKHFRSKPDKTILGKMHLINLRIGRFKIKFERYRTLYNNLNIIASRVPIATPLKPNGRTKINEIKVF